MIQRDLEPLLPEEAREFALRIAPRLESHAEELAHLCGYLPVALREPEICWWSTGTSRRATASAVSQETHQRLALVEDSIAPALRLTLSGIAAAVENALCVSGGFESVDAGAIWGVNGETAQDSLSVLLACNMLQWSESPAQYRLHDLLRLWASAQCSDDERRSIQQKLAEYAATVLARANEMFLRGGESLRKGLDVYDKSVRT